MVMKISTIKDKVLSLLYVKDIKCIYCNKELNMPDKYCMCKNCFTHLKFNNNKVCKKCGIKIFGEIDICRKCVKNKRSFEKAISVFEYEGTIKDLVKKFKFSGSKYLGEYLGKFMVDKYSESNINADLVLPVPLHSSSYKKRGFNQAAELAKCFESILPVNYKCLIKTKKTPKQAKSDLKSRLTNLTGCFDVINPEVIKGKTILLIDDIYTTGATAEECAKTLHTSGAGNVYVLTLCSSVYNYNEKVGWID